MAKLLFEVGVEELPALSVESAAEFMQSFLEQKFLDLRIDCAGLQAFSTPRRLVVLADELASKQKDSEEEVLGPNVAIAYDSAGGFSKAALGFINAKGLKESDLYKKTTEKGEVLAAKKIHSGKATKEILPALLTELLHAIPFKKRMRWDSSRDSFARPIRRLVCLFDGEYLPLQFADVTSGKESRGHRFMANEPFEVISNEAYLTELKKRFVILKSEDREAMFIKGAEEKLAALGLSFRNDPDLMATVRNLSEYPLAILGSFEERYLAVPKEILICEMKAHQKCFAVYNQDGSLRPLFICSAGTKPYDEEIFAKGNARVLRARFEDGAFYFAEDKKKSLAEHGKQLDSLIFERDLGTVAQKSARIEEVCLGLAHHFGLEGETPLIKRAVPLLKADLVTGVVGQFPELQGVMGRIYADLEGQDKKVGQIIETHYWPRFFDDELPPCKVSALCSLADKLDTVVGIIAIGKKPSGNKDPFALRRCAIAVVRMLIHYSFSIDLNLLIDISLKSFGERFKSQAPAIKEQVQEFITQRARGLLIEDLGKENKEYAVNFADSVLATGAYDLLDIFARAHTLYAMRLKNKDEFDSLVQAIKRASNIVKKAPVSQSYVLSSGHAQYLVTAAEVELLQTIKETKGLAQPAVAKADFVGLQKHYFDMFSQIALIKPKLSAFFDSVMVMVDDEKIKTARLALLSEIKNVADKIADFTHL